MNLPRYSPVKIESPCIKVCEMDPRSRLCKGCFRTIEEISYWATMGSEARARLMREIAVRRGEASPH